MYKLHYYPSNANLAPHILLEEIGAPRAYPHLGPFLEAMAARPAVQRALAQEGLKAPFY